MAIYHSDVSLPEGRSCKHGGISPFVPHGARAAFVKAQPDLPLDELTKKTPRQDGEGGSGKPTGEISPSLRYVHYK